MALDLPIQDFPGPTFLKFNSRFGLRAFWPISMSWIASREEMMVLDQLNGPRSTNPGLPRTYFSQLQQLFWPQGFSVNFHVLDHKQERNVGPGLAQWLQIYQSRTSQNPLFSTLIAIFAKMLLCQFPCPGLQEERNYGSVDLSIHDFPGPIFLNSNSRFGHRAARPISMSWNASRNEMTVRDQLKVFRFTIPGVLRDLIQRRRKSATMSKSAAMTY